MSRSVSVADPETPIGGAHKIVKFDDAPFDKPVIDTGVVIENHDPDESDPDCEALSDAAP